VDEGHEMDTRVARLAALDIGVHFVPLADLVPFGDLSYHAVDRIHPSMKGSRAIGQRIARVIAEAEGMTAVSRNTAPFQDGSRPAYRPERRP
jgi:lysophospholipase L1-like esterase